MTGAHILADVSDGFKILRGSILIEERREDTPCTESDDMLHGYIAW